MKLLILGGTQFVGRHTVQAALDCGHQVTLFNRGQTNADLFPTVERLRGDRGLRGSAADLTALRGRTWDAVIDVNGYVPRQVREVADVLRGNVGHYTFISTISVFEAFETPGLTETSKLAAFPDSTDPTAEEITGETYGPLKVACESAVEEAFADHALIVRPGLVVGPDDHTDRFTYWPVRIAQGGEVLLPGTPPGRLSSVIDGRDLAAFTISATERAVTGAFNATSPSFRFETLAEICHAVAQSEATLTWVDEALLQEQKVGPWSELPLWLPFDLTPDVSKISAAGMTFRPLAETVRDTLAWDRERGDGPRKFTFTAERERDLLAAWAQRR
jgi:2'-hydroxyisoflavone reductase